MIKNEDQLANLLRWIRLMLAEGPYANFSVHQTAVKMIDDALANFDAGHER